MPLGVGLVALEQRAAHAEPLRGAVNDAKLRRSVTGAPAIGRDAACSPRRPEKPVFAFLIGANSATGLVLARSVQSVLLMVPTASRTGRQ
jgi:hypothetical protein